jgi:hypothetical protein
MILAPLDRCATMHVSLTTTTYLGLGAMVSKCQPSIGEARAKSLLAAVEGRDTRAAGVYQEEQAGVCWCSLVYADGRRAPNTWIRQPRG